MFTTRFTMRSAAADPGARADSYAAMLDMVLDCVNAGFEVVVPRDAVAGVPPDYAEAVVDNTLRLLARIERTDEAGRLGRSL